MDTSIKPICMGVPPSALGVTGHAGFRLPRMDCCLSMERARVQQGRGVEPSAEIIDSQPAEGADNVGRGSRAYDAGT